MPISLPSSIWMGFYYIGFFGVFGIFLPFWALWLKGEGMDAESIGSMLAFALLARSAGALVLTRNVNSIPSILSLMQRLALSSMLAFCLFYLSNNVYFIFCLVVLSNFIFSPLMSLGETVAAKLVRYKNMDYGKVRLWGSIAFMVASAITGFLVERFDHTVILLSIIISLGGLFLLVLVPIRALPEEESAVGQERISVWRILSRSSFWPFLLITALLQGAHAAYYGFGAVYWQDIGISETYIGYFWSMGVIGEIFFLAFGKRFFGEMSIAMMFAIAAIGSIVRWLTLAYAVDVTTIMISQLLHGVTFGISHLAAMRYMSERVSNEEAVATQSIYAAIPFSLGIAVLTFACGLLYPSMQQGIFVIMAVAVLPVLFLISSKQIRG